MCPLPWVQHTQPMLAAAAEVEAVAEVVEGAAAAARTPAAALPAGHGMLGGAAAGVAVAGEGAAAAQCPWQVLALTAQEWAQGAGRRRRQPVSAAAMRPSGALAVRAWVWQGAGRRRWQLAEASSSMALLALQVAMG